jgi:hypothetical protein
MASDESDKPTKIIVNVPNEVKRRLFPNYPDDAQISKFFEVLGRAVSLWQLVETSLYEVYERALAPRHPGAAAAGFHAIQTFQMKLTVTDAAVRFALLDHSELIDEWQKPRRDADAKSARRNQFVHLSTWIMYNEESPNDRIRLEPQMFDTRHRASGSRDKSPKLRMTEITEISEKFEPLSGKLRSFSQKIPAPKTPNNSTL